MKRRFLAGPTSECGEVVFQTLVNTLARWCVKKIQKGDDTQSVMVNDRVETKEKSIRERGTYPDSLLEKAYVPRMPGHRRRPV